VDKGLASFLYGSAITLLTSLFSRAFADGGLGFGWPFIFVIYPFGFPPFSQYVAFMQTCLLLDIAFWATIAFALRFWIPGKLKLHFSPNPVAPT